jgi:uncharacterized membrane protein
MPLLMRISRRLVAWLFVLASVGVALYAFAYLYDDRRPVDAFAARFAAAGLEVPVHFFIAALALLLGPLQLAEGVRRRWPRVHRIGGWLYAAAVLVGGSAGLGLAAGAQGGWLSALGFAVLAVLWMATTARGVRLAMRGDIAGHRRWMCRSVALTFSAVTLRIMLGVGVGLMGLPFLQVYVAAAWASWLLNLGACECLLRLRPWRRPRLRGSGGTRLASGRAAA